MSAHATPVILPGATLGVLGGGQLGRMFAHAAQAMGYFTAVLDPDPASPAGLVSHFHIQTDYLDEQGLAQLMQRCAAITTEFENVPAGALVTLGAHFPAGEAQPHTIVANAASARAVTTAASAVPGVVRATPVATSGRSQATGAASALQWAM